MSEQMRQTNLFSAEDYKKVFKAYSFIDYTAYDFDTLKQALLNYIQTYYPEDFNDYIESSEFIAIVELLAYFGTSLAFRTDLNSRENFIDTAERRESIIRLAQMVNYVPRRNVPASGLFKIASVQTNQPLVDANGININDVSIFWNDPNNPDWFDQFIQVCNAAFNPTNPFGRPSKSGVIGSIPTDLYDLNSVTRLSVVYPVTISVNGQQYPIDICNPNFISGETIFEKDPDPDNAFSFIYRNDSLGVSSDNTGFFLFFKQGNLINVDSNFEFPVPNRLFPIDTVNINQDDVYVQETNQNGTVVSKWLKVPALSGENIIYNSIQYGERNIFDVISGANNTITVRFADGNFGNIPTGLFRFWVRISANQNLVIRPDDAQGLQINIPYIGSDNQQYILRLVFNLHQTISNAAPAETNEQIRLRAPEVFSTQSRMVNGSDYNVLPLIYGNQLAKIQAIDRTYSGQSRYIDLNDPTGFHRDLIIFGQDGALYRDNQNILSQVVEDASNTATIDTILINTIQETLRSENLYNFFYDEYITQFESTIRVNKQTPADAGYSLLDLNNPYQNKLYWKPSPAKLKNTTGYFSSLISSTSQDDAAPLINTLTTLNPSVNNTNTYNLWGLIRSSSILNFADPNNISTTTTSVAVNNVVQAGIPLIINPLNPYKNIGPVEISNEQKVNYLATKLLPSFRTTLNDTEIATIKLAILDGISFWMYYDLLTDTWNTSTTTIPGISNQSQEPFVYPPPNNVGTSTEQIYSTWKNYPNSGLLYVSIASNNDIGTITYDITARGRVYVFESYRDVRFYWEPGQIVIDNASGLALEDTIEIMPFINTNSSIDNNLPVIVDPATSYLRDQVNFKITGVFIQDDGYTDTSKIEVSLIDKNSNNVVDNPGSFNQIVSPEDRVVFEYYTNEITGYQTTRPWVSKWKTEFSDYTGDLYVYFPVNPENSTILFSAPYIANHQFTPGVDQSYILNPSSYTEDGFKFVYMDDVDLMFINNINQITFNNTLPVISITNQITAFFNGPTAADLINYPWLYGTNQIVDKTDIITNYFISKSFLISDISPPGYGVYYSVNFESTNDILSYPASKLIIEGIDKYHFDRNGKVFTQNENISANDRLPLYFKWSHFCPIDQRVDPSASNIIDMIAITYGYYNDMIVWKNSNGTLSSMPAPPTTEDLRIQFQGLEQYKMISDSMIWNSGKFKILFGPQAEKELQATFKVVKSPSTNISDNEVKTKIIQAIDAYFDIRNWDFGEKFFYTELAAFIHQQLSRIISSVVIVPNNANSQFGNLFEILAGPTELFLSTATVNNVQIVSNYTDQNLRV